MISLKPFGIALRRDPIVERFISEELKIPIRFYDLARSSVLSDDVECIWTDMTTTIDSSYLVNYPNLRFIATTTTGLTHIILDKNELSNLRLISLKGESNFLKDITATAELAWALALAIWRRIFIASLEYKTDVKIRSKFAGLQLKNLTIGTIGFGRIGQMLSNYAQAFGMKTVYYDPFLDKKFDSELSAASRVSSLQELCSLADIVFLVASHSTDYSSTYPILKRESLMNLKSSAIVVNVSRGSLLDEEALADLISDGRIFGAGIDVLSREESNPDNLSRLQELQKEGYNVIVTPHIGGMCSDAFEKTNRLIAQRLNSELMHRNGR